MKKEIASRLRQIRKHLSCLDSIYIAHLVIPPMAGQKAPEYSREIKMLLLKEGLLIKRRTHQMRGGTKPWKREMCLFVYSPKCPKGSEDVQRKKTLRKEWKQEF